MNTRAQALGAVRRIVIKVGTGVVTRPDGRLALGRLGALAEDIHDLIAAGYQVMVVSSGAIGLGAGRLGLDAIPVGVVDRQACAAAGQGALVATWDSLLSRLGHPVAQVLLTEDDFLHRQRYINLHATLERLLEAGAVPIVNENDTVSTTELAVARDRVFGDNDQLSALVSSGTDADLLVLLSDVNGVYTAPPGTEGAERISTWEGESVTIGTVSARGRGGMGAKISAALMAAHGGTHVVIASGEEPGVVGRVLAGENVGTWFPAAAGLSRKRRWLAYATAPEGVIRVNEGARTALVESSASLLPAGIVGVTGTFAEGAVVSLATTEGPEFGRGVCALSSDSLRQVVGRTGGQRAVVHRDNVVLLRTGGDA
ncbi:MAG: glutamate 5-kinase [Myxococcota bacterium]|jgi:glutamate 5-kinase